MSRTLIPPAALVIAILLAAAVRAAEPPPPGDRERPARPVWGTVTKATADSLTIQPEAPARSRRRAQSEPPPEPAERSFALLKNETELAFAEVGMQRPMVDGTMVRTLNDPEPATAADLKPGQLVGVTPAPDGAATARQVFIIWSVPGTIVKVDAETLTFRPAAAGSSAQQAPDAPPSRDPDPDDAPAAEDADDQTLDISKSATRVRIAAASDARPAPGGRFVTTVDYKNATLADLKPDQSVIVCIRNGAAAKITILERRAKP